MRMRGRRVVVVAIAVAASIVAMDTAHTTAAPLVCERAIQLCILCIRCSP